MNLTLTQLFPLLSMIFILSLGTIVLLKNKTSILHKLFFLISLVFAIWQFGTFMMFINSEEQKIIFWDRFIYLGVVFMPALQYHFSLVFTYFNKKREILLIIAYIFSFIFLILSRTNYFVADIFRYRWGVHAEAKILHHFFLAFFFFYIFALLYNFFIQYKKSKIKIEQRRLIYIMVGFTILNLIGGLGYLPAYKISIYSPISLLAPLVFSIIIAYAIVRYRLLDIKFVLRKSTVYLASLTVILVLAIWIKYIFLLFFTNITDWVDLIILIISIFLFSPIKHFFYKIANKYFFTSLYDSQEVVAELSDKLRTSLKINEIYNFIYEVLSNAFHVKVFGFLSYNEKTGAYFLQYNNGIDFRKRKKIQSNKYLHEKFIKNNKPIVTEEIKNAEYNKKTKKFIDLLSSLKIEVLAPLNLKNNTVGLLALGQKESGDMYNNEDFMVLKVVSSQAAIAIENAFLYKKTQDFNVKLKKEIKKATQYLVVANQRLMRLDQAKSEFISIASHQLRTPLTIIKGYVSMMLEGDFGELKLKQKDSLNKVYESGERMIQLVNNLLNISRIEAGHLEFNYETVNFENIVNNIVDDLKKTIKQKKLRLDYIKLPEQLPLVKIDLEKIRQVLINLIDNAIKYTKQGSITVSLKAINQKIQFCVSDSGVGISKNDLPKLFKKFSRGKTISRIHTEGTGLGLYVARKMVEAHNGKIWAESKGENRGSQFYFQLPVG